MESEDSSRVQFVVWRPPGRPFVGIILTLVALVTSGCFLDRSVIPGLADPGISVLPSLVCSGETVTVSWSVPSYPTTGCYRRTSAGEHLCPVIDNVLQDGSSMGVGAGEYPGTRSVTVTSDTTFEINTLQYRASDGAAYQGYNAASVSVINGAGSNRILFDGVCSGWGSVDLSGYSSCLNIDSICLLDPRPDTPHVTVFGLTANGDGTFTETARAILDPNINGGCSDPGVDFTGSDELRATEDVTWPNPPGGATECARDWPDIILMMNLSCPSDLGSCSAVGRGGGGENEPSFDSAAQPTPTANSSQMFPSGDVTEEPPLASIPGICEANGGLQWEGDVCVCSGFIDHVTICKDGTKTDTVTEKTCLPDPQACSDSGGSNAGDPTCGVKPCGNSLCQPECGENVDSCPADCK